MPILNVNGIQLNYIEQGNGEALVLIHNVISNVDGFVYNMPKLAKHYRTVACDLRGHGKTTHMDSEADAADFYTFDNNAEDIHQMLRSLGIESCHLFGQAYWGVSTALTFFYHHPEMVKSIVCASCHILSSDPGAQPFDRLDAEAKKGFQRMHELARAESMSAVFEERKKLRVFWSDHVLDNPDIMARFAEMYRATSPVAFLFFPHLSHERRAAIAARLAENKTPLMLLMGAEDSHNDEMIRNLREDYPDSHVVLLPFAGHYPTIENPADFNRALLNFYAGVDSRG